jgi:hypothetical protein
MGIAAGSGGCLRLSAIGYRLSATVRNFHEWRAALSIDPSAADLYKTNFSVDAVGIVIILAVAAVVFYLLRPRAAKQP